MKEDTWWKLVAGTGLITLSLTINTIHYLIFQDAYHIFIYFVGELVFIPIEVLVVTLIIDQMLESREKQQRMEKLNMVIGTFFSTTGTPLRDRLVRADPGIGVLRQRLVVSDRWRKNDFVEIKAVMGNNEGCVAMERVDLDAVRDFLVKNEDFLFRLAENPMIFKHESFTDLILALSHLTEELKGRDTFSGLPTDDTGHLAIY